METPQQPTKLSFEESNLDIITYMLKDCEELMAHYDRMTSRMTQTIAELRLAKERSIRQIVNLKREAHTAETSESTDGTDG